MARPMVAGVGATAFGRHPERTVVDLGAEAARQALLDAGLRPDQIGLGFLANALATSLFGDATVGQNILWEVGINRIPVINVENACTSGSTAFYLACQAVAAGQTAAALVVGAEKMCVPEFGLIDSGKSEWETQLGLVAPASFALRARRHMAEFGTTTEDMALVAVKNRAHAASNPLALFREPITVAQVLEAPMIVDPLTRLQCCPIADGAAAVVVLGPDLARQVGAKVEVRCAVLGTGDYRSPQDLARWETDYRVCGQAYEAAGLGPEDLDLVECHDAFSISEILHYEALGLCPAGEGGRFVREGHASLGGRVPVNPSGGLLSRGHPVGATGVLQVVEVVRQLRGQAGPRQVPDAKIGLAHCMGGDKAGDTKSCTVAILGI